MISISFINDISNLPFFQSRSHSVFLFNFDTIFNLVMVNKLNVTIFKEIEIPFYYNAEVCMPFVKGNTFIDLMLDLFDQNSLQIN